MRPIGRVKQILAAVLLCALTAVAYTPSVQAGPQQSSSSHYGVSEVNFGSGGELNACSSSYCSKQSAGELTVGNTSSANYQAQAGFNTNREELLEVNVPGTSINFGTLNAITTGKGSSTFSVRTYLASGYIVTIGGSSPMNTTSSHQITAISSPDISRPGTEQFGINLVHNNTPSIGADPVETPDSTFSFGTAASGYGTTDNFKFVSGDTVAQSLKSSGTTTYTLSAIENVANNTPNGTYHTQLTINVIPTF